MKIIIVNNRTEVRDTSVEYLWNCIKYLSGQNHPDDKDKVGKRTTKIWNETIYLAPNHTKLTKKERKLTRRKLLSTCGENETFKITTTILS